MEILVVSVIALIVFGPQRLPEIARSVGRALNEFKRQASDIRAEFESGLEVEDEPTKPGPIVHKGTTPERAPIAKLPDDPKPEMDPDPGAGDEADDSPATPSEPVMDPDPETPGETAEERDAPPSPS